MIVTDGATWYTYTITKPPYRTLPSDTGVLNSVPAPLDKAATPSTDPAVTSLLRPVIQSGAAATG